MMGVIHSICISEKKGVVKKAIDYAEFIEDFGIKGDAHAGKWHRQVSLLSKQSIDEMKKELPFITNGSFAENIVVDKLELKNIKIGDKFQIGNKILLEVTQIGKKCHSECIIGQTTGKCIMPTEGIFARVLKGGSVNVGTSIEIIEK